MQTTRMGEQLKVSMACLQVWYADLAECEGTRTMRAAPDTVWAASARALSRGRPAATAPSASASMARNTYAGPLPLSPVTASIMRSSTLTAKPDPIETVSTRRAPQRGTSLPIYHTATLGHTRAANHICESQIVSGAAQVRIWFTRALLWIRLPCRGVALTRHSESRKEAAAETKCMQA